MIAGHLDVLMVVPSVKVLMRSLFPYCTSHYEMLESIDKAVLSGEWKGAGTLPSVYTVRGVILLKRSMYYLLKLFPAMHEVASQLARGHP